MAGPDDEQRCWLEVFSTGQAVMNGIPYCGAPPVPGTLADRFNLDPWLILALLVMALGHMLVVHRNRRSVLFSGLGWAIAAAALVSPLCALSVSLFAARVGQHMILVLVAEPLIALSLPAHWSIRGGTLWLSALVFMLALWFWHMPAPYAETFASSLVYWIMHVTLFASSVWLWFALLRHPRTEFPSALAVGAVTSIQMGLLGAVLTLSAHPLFAPHAVTTIAWGFTPLEDQRLGGVFMWVPGIFFFLWAVIRSSSIIWSALEGEQA